MAIEQYRYFCIRHIYLEEYWILDENETKYARVYRKDGRCVYTYDNLMGDKKRGCRSIKETLKKHLNANAHYYLETTTTKPLDI